MPLLKKFKLERHHVFIRRHSWIIVDLIKWLACLDLPSVCATSQAEALTVSLDLKEQTEVQPDDASAASCLRRSEFQRAQAERFTGGSVCQPSRLEQQYRGLERHRRGAIESIKQTKEGCEDEKSFPRRVWPHTGTDHLLARLVSLCRTIKIIEEEIESWRHFCSLSF